MKGFALAFLMGLSVGATPPIDPAAHAPPGNAIRVKGVNGDTVLQLLPTEGGGMVRAELLTRLLGGSFDSIAEGRWRLALYGATLEIQAGAPFAAYDGFPLPLIEATRVVDGVAHVSLQLFSEIIPRFGIGILWDRSRAEVRLFQGIARRASPASTAAPTAEPTKAVAIATPVRTASATPATPVPGGTGLTRKYTVVVDAGHGGVDPGNPGSIVGGRRVRESAVTLGIALKLERELEKRGINVYMTRRTDTLIALGDRGRLANERRGDLFVSIHTNGANPRWRNASAARGFETYFLATAQTEDDARVAAMENDAVRFETVSVDPPRGDPLSFIIADMAQNEHLRESSEFATGIQHSLAEPHPGPNRGVKQADFSVLRGAHMPAILVEVGFGSNREDATWMAGSAGQQAAAIALADATVEYLLRYERRTRSTQR